MSARTATSKRAAVLAERAWCLRQQETWSEQLLWSRLRACQLGVKFLRQVVLGQRFIVDFFAPSVGLIVEVDGLVHCQRAALDARRDRVLRRMGFRVLRLPAELVEQRLEEAVQRVREALAQE
jgi:very-short-patch-repair endonuclease